MKFRPCIDLHHGQVKQIVGSTLRDDDNNNNHHHQTGGGDSQQNVFPNESSCHHNTTNSPTPTPCSIQTNFSTTRPAADFARMYQRDGLTGGHVIMLGPGNEQAATAALQAYPQGLQVGGGITNVNAKEWLDKGASHVIVTSFVFSNGTIDMERLQQLVDAVGGKQHLVLDLSCRRRRRTSTSTTTSTSDDPYYVVTDRWQTFTDTPVTAHTLHTLAQYCDEFLVHGVDVEGQQCGILEDLVQLLGQASPIPVTYAGGVRSMEDVDWVRRVGQGRVDLTIGSALDCFGGTLPYQHVVEWHNAQQRREQTNE